MALEKWTPLKEIESMRREMDRLWNEIFPTSRRFLRELPVRALVERETVAPAIDIIDRPDEVVVRAEMPGVDKDNIDISLQENTLTITGQVKEEKEEKEENYYYRERSYSNFSRAIEIPFKADANNIRASLKNGILTVHLPKAPEVQPKKIPVEVEEGK